MGANDRAKGRRTDGLCAVDAEYSEKSVGVSRIDSVISLTNSLPAGKFTIS